MKKFVQLFTLILASMPVHAINECVDKNGKKVFSDMPCSSNNAKSATVPADIQTRREQDRKRQESLTPPELMKAYDRCNSAAGLRSLTNFSKCLTRDPDYQKQDYAIEKLMQQWRTELKTHPVIKSSEFNIGSKYGKIVVELTPQFLDTYKNTELYVKRTMDIRFKQDNDLVWRVYDIF